MHFNLLSTLRHPVRTAELLFRLDFRRRGSLGGWLNYREPAHLKLPHRRRCGHDTTPDLGYFSLPIPRPLPARPSNQPHTGCLLVDERRIALRTQRVVLRKTLLKFASYFGSVFVHTASFVS